MQQGGFCVRASFRDAGSAGGADHMPGWPDAQYTLDNTIQKPVPPAHPAKIVDCDALPLDSAAMFGIKSPIEDAYYDAIHNRLFSMVYFALNEGISPEHRKSFREDWRERGSYHLVQLLKRCASADWSSYPETFWMKPKPTVTGGPQGFNLSLRRRVLESCEPIKDKEVLRLGWQDPDEECREIAEKRTGALRSWVRVK
jgi:hypothetical protein